jgi:hypothetical protein
MDELKKLYREGFPEDSKDWVEYFFRERIRDAEVFSYSEGGKILSAAYIFTRKLRVLGRETALPFLVAAATLTEFRGKKIFHNVMREIFSRYKNEPFIALYPFKHEYYKKNFGFENFNYLPSAAENFPLNEAVLVNFPYQKGLFEVLNGIYSARAEKFDAYVVRGKEYFEKKAAEWRADGGEIGLIYPDLKETNTGNGGFWTSENDGEKKESDCKELNNGDGGFWTSENDGGKKESDCKELNNGDGGFWTSENGGEKKESDCKELNNGDGGFWSLENGGGAGNRSDFNEPREKNAGFMFAKNNRERENFSGRVKKEKKPVGYVFFTESGAVEEICFVNSRFEEKFCGKTAPKPAMMIKILNEKRAAEILNRHTLSDLKTFSLEKY